MQSTSQDYDNKWSGCPTISSSWEAPSDVPRERRSRVLLSMRLSTGCLSVWSAEVEEPGCRRAPGEGVSDAEWVDVTVEMTRIEGLSRGSRKVWFNINGKTQVVEVKDSSGKFVFSGPMANTKKPGQMGSPMPGHVEKLLVKKGQAVKAGETLCTVSAMKMEVKVTAPFDAKVSDVTVAVGTRVVENALLVGLEFEEA
eukprot:gene18203-24646_t